MKMRKPARTARSTAAHKYDVALAAVKQMADLPDIRSLSARYNMVMLGMITFFILVNLLIF